MDKERYEKEIQNKHDSIVYCFLTAMETNLINYKVNNVASLSSSMLMYLSAKDHLSGVNK